MAESDAASQGDDGTAGYIRPGEGYEDIANADHKWRRAALIHQQREQAQRDAAGQGTFRLDLEAMRKLLPRWKSIRDRFRRLRDDGDRLEQVQKPADDKASDRQIQAAGAHQEIYATIAKQMYEYAKAYVDSLERAIAESERADEAARDATRQPGQAL